VPGNRKEELLLAPDELAVIGRVRKASQNQGGTAIELLLGGLSKTTSNAQFLT
jgi:transcription termination factor Rho